MTDDLRATVAVLRAADRVCHRLDDGGLMPGGLLLALRDLQTAMQALDFQYSADLMSDAPVIVEPPILAVLAQVEALCAVTEAARTLVAIRQPLGTDDQGTYCIYCTAHDPTEFVGTLAHDADCPWLMLRTVLASASPTGTGQAQRAGVDGEGAA